MFVLFVVRTVAWNVKSHEGRKDLNSTKMDQRGKTPDRKKIPMGARDFSLLQKSRPALGPTQISTQSVPGFFPGVKRLGRKAYRSPPSSEISVY
jgi:hypothetical protein